MNPPARSVPVTESVPLVVDLDGTLVHTDLALESLMLLAKNRPWRLLTALFWLFDGIAYFKQKLAQEVIPDVTALPFDPGLLAFLAQQKASGRRLVMATGADERLAAAVADHTKLFDEVIASDGVTNLSGVSKRDRLVAEFGAGGFDYAGNGWRDRPVWAAARHAILVNAPERYQHQVGESVEVERIFSYGGGGPAACWKAVRPNQWVKNLLVFVPLLTAGERLESSLILGSLIAFAAFSLCASSGYVFNDLMDLPSDRHHPSKKNRPLASGQLSPALALALVPILLLSGVAIGAFLSLWFVGVLIVYYVLTVTYSLRLKDIVILDVVVLSTLYTLRVVGGTLAAGLEESVWLLAFCIFLFLSLGLIKRYAELVLMRSVEGMHAHARAYLLQDRELLAGFGAASGYVAGLVLVLFFISRHRVSGALDMDLAGWGMCLLYLYWISYLWLVAHRGRMEDDPLSFALRDRVSRILILFTVATFASTWI